MIWQQIYNPFNNMAISTLPAAIPMVVMLACLGLIAAIPGAVFA